MERKNMINYENLLNLLENTDINYFSIVSDSRDVYKNLKGDITKVSDLFAVQKLVNKISLEEYANKKYQKIEQDDNIVIERELEHDNYKFTRIGSFKDLDDIMSTAISIPAMYVFIDSGNTFERFSLDLDNRDIPYVLVKYRHGQFHVDKKIFPSIDRLGSYIMKKYYL